MVRRVLAFVFNLCALAALAQEQTSVVKTVGDVSFAVPPGWVYTAAADVGAMVYKEGDKFWLVAVYTPMPATADADADFKSAWRRTVLTQPGYRNVPNYNPYDIGKMAGYPGKYYDDDSIDHKSTTRLYTLRTGKSCIPVVFISANQNMLNGMEYLAMAIAGSVRQAPLKASPIRNTITVADLEGHWTSGLINSIDFYNSSGQYQSNSLTAIRTDYTIAANGHYTYKLGGLLNNRSTTDEDSGVIELNGAFITFKGRKWVRRYRFVNLQQTLDGSTVLTLWPPVEMSAINSRTDSEFYTRAAKK